MLELVIMLYNIPFQHPYNEKQLRNAAGRLASFIGVRELPSPDLQHLASRYIMELSLPGNHCVSLQNAQC